MRKIIVLALVEEMDPEYEALLEETVDSAASEDVTRLKTMRFDPM